MIPYKVVTSWSDEGERLYGDKFVQGFGIHWSTPHGIYLDVFTDNDLLAIDSEIEPFRLREADSETTCGSFRRGAMKFSWKVFALASQAIRQTYGWMVWIDGDVEFTSTPTKAFFQAVCPTGADISFLGRPWAYATETGFVAYNMASTRVQDLLKEMRRTYISGEFRALGYWGDGYVFDHCRSKLDLVENDLAKDCKEGDLHVWPKTVLGSCMQHRKGPNRKRKAYGGAV